MMATKRSVCKSSLPDFKFPDSCVGDIRFSESGSYEIKISGFVKNKAELNKFDREYLGKCLCAYSMICFIGASGLLPLFTQYLEKFKKEGRF